MINYCKRKIYQPEIILLEKDLRSNFLKLLLPFLPLLVVLQGTALPTKGTGDAGCLNCSPIQAFRHSYYFIRVPQQA
jgi:hypothetical protein